MYGHSPQKLARRGSARTGADNNSSAARPTEEWGQQRPLLSRCHQWSRSDRSSVEHYERTDDCFRLGADYLHPRRRIGRPVRPGAQENYSGWWRNQTLVHKLPEIAIKRDEPSIFVESLRDSVYITGARHYFRNGGDIKTGLA